MTVFEQLIGLLYDSGLLQLAWEILSRGAPPKI